MNGVARREGGASLPPQTKKTDWFFIASIVVTAVLAYFTLFPLLCSQGVFPQELIGGQFGIGMGISIGASLTIISGLIAYLKWKHPIE